MPNIAGRSTRSTAQMKAAPRLYPDPTLSANIYCGGRLDEVVSRLVGPFWFTLEGEDGSCGHLWVARYHRGGEHLKIRLHGPIGEGKVPRRLLSERAEQFFSELPESESHAGATTATTGAHDGPPVDREDEQDHRDNSLVWTEYRRSAVAFAGRPFLDDGTYLALATKCMALGTARILALVLDDGNRFSYGLRQRTLLSLLISGMAGLGFAAEELRAYLIYHRDWLIRFSLRRDCSTPEKGRQMLLEHFAQRLAQMAASRETLRQLTRRQWHHRDQDERDQDERNPDDMSWRRALRELREHVAALVEDPAFRVDPFATDPAFYPIFKVFHGVANALGLKLNEEAFTYHLLLHSFCAEAEGEVCSRVAR